MSNVYVRIVSYMLFGAALGLSVTGLATFDPATGDFDMLPFNVYSAGAAIAALLGPFAIFKRWGAK